MIYVHFHDKLIHEPRINFINFLLLPRGKHHRCKHCCQLRYFCSLDLDVLSVSGMQESLVDMDSRAATVVSIGKLMHDKFIAGNRSGAAMIREHVEEIPESWIMFIEAFVWMFQRETTIEANHDHHQQYRPWVFSPQGNQQIMSPKTTLNLRVLFDVCGFGVDEEVFQRLMAPKRNHVLGLYELFDGKFLMQNGLTLKECRSEILEKGRAKNQNIQ